MPGRKKKSPAQKILSQTSSGSVASLPSVSQTEQDSGGRESIRFKIGMLYVKAFVGIIAAALIIGWISRYTVSEIKDLLLAISGILSGPLGFIIGFYFKESSQDKT